jgi:hypothetical protein
VDLPEAVWRRLRVETDHALRAALICLLTAALAAQGTAAVIGDAESGWFWLPHTFALDAPIVSGPYTFVGETPPARVSGLPQQNVNSHPVNFF